MREVGELRALVQEAADAAGTREEDSRTRLAQGVEEAVERVREEEWRRKEELEGQGRGHGSVVVVGTRRRAWRRWQRGAGRGGVVVGGDQEEGVAVASARRRALRCG